MTTKVGWLMGYYPFSEFKVEGDKVSYGGNDRYMNSHILTTKVIENSMNGYKQGGGMGKKDLLRCRLGGNVRDGFRELEGKADEYFRKNGNLDEKRLDGMEKVYMLSLKTLEGGKEKIFVKIYRKKNI